MTKVKKKAPKRPKIKDAKGLWEAVVDATLKPKTYTDILHPRAREVIDKSAGKPFTPEVFELMVSDILQLPTRAQTEVLLYLAVHLRKPSPNEQIV
jgi:hypothetical protein